MERKGSRRAGEHHTDCNQDIVLSSTQEHHTDCEQEYGTQVVHRNIAHIVSRNTVPSWYTRTLHMLQSGYGAQ